MTPRILEPWCPYRESPHSSERDPGEEVTHLVVHYSGSMGSMTGLTRWLTGPDAAVSYHLLIGRDGRALQLVDFNRKAWHAGWGNLNGGEEKMNANVGSIGLAFCNAGRSKAPTPLHTVLVGDYYWEPYTDEAMATYAKVLRWFARYKLTVVGHEDIALPRGRKHDPGPLFPAAT